MLFLATAVLPPIAIVKEAHMLHARTWKEALQGHLSPELEAEVNIYATQIELRRQDKIDDRSLPRPVCVVGSTASATTTGNATTASASNSSTIPPES